MGYLELRKSEHRGVRYVELDEEPLTIGRSSSNRLPLPDSQVSRRHCVIQLKNGAFRLTDVGSTYGTSVNGKPVRSAQLDEGDRIDIGPYWLLFHDAPLPEHRRRRANFLDLSRRASGGNVLEEGWEDEGAAASGSALGLASSASASGLALPAEPEDDDAAPHRAEIAPRDEPGLVDARQSSTGPDALPSAASRQDDLPPDDLAPEAFAPGGLPSSGASPAPEASSAEELKALRDERAALQRERLAIHQRLSAVEAALERAAADAAEARRRDEEQKGHLAARDAELATLRKRLDELDAERAEAIRRLEEALSELRSAQAARVEEQARLEQFANETDTLRRSLEEAERLLAMTQDVPGPVYFESSLLDEHVDDRLDELARAVEEARATRGVTPAVTGTGTASDPIETGEAHT